MRYLLLATRTILTLAATALAGLTGYLLLLTGAAVLGKGALASGRAVPPDAARRRRFALLVPAHDEETTIGRLLESTRQLAYPADRFDVYLVADNCSDRTAEVARAGGARVEERFDQTARGKGYALRWLLTRLRERGALYDAYVVIDSVTIVAPDLLSRLDAHFEAGSQVIQVYYTVLNVGAVTFAQAESQNERWERGRLEMLRERGLALLLDGLRLRDPVRVDAVLEQLIPPLSVPVVLAGAVLGGSSLCRARLAGLLSGFSLGGQLAYVLAGLMLVGAPGRVYRALAYAPAYIGWKVWLYARSLGARGAAPWVRTARLPPSSGPATER